MTLISSILLLGFAAATPKDVSLTASDGTVLHAAAELADSKKRGVVLVHGEQRSSGDWRFVSEKLVRSGVSAVSVDLRGHGTSGKSFESLTDPDFLAMEHDVRAAVDWLRSQGVTEVSCAGASVGANLCLRVASEDPAIVNLALLSPTLNTKGLTTAGAMVKYGDRPVLIVASANERFDGTFAEKLEQRAVGQKHLELLEDAGTGTKMLSRDPSLEGILLSWLLGTYELGAGEVVRPRPAGETKLEDIKTDGKKLDIQ